MTTTRLTLALLAGLMVVSAGLPAVAEGYNYPFGDPLVATVIGTPKEFMPELPREVRSKEYELTVFADREVPDLFWHEKKFRFSLAYQKTPAPLLFVIAGTGASHRSAKMLEIEKVFFQQGYHVISISSPTHPNFIVSASTSGIPGDLREDSADLYRVMELCMQKIGKKIEVTDYYLTGYSLGGTQSAFVSKLDEEKKRFNFKKVLMINPSVSLFNSVNFIDTMLADNIPGGLDHFDAFFKDMMNRFSKVYGSMQHVSFNDDFLYRVYEYKDKQVDDGNVKALIGTSFRISSGNMVFTADAISKSGVIVPPQYDLKKHEHTEDFLKVSTRMSFNDYFNELLYPYYKTKHPNVSQDQMIEDASLQSIKGYLAGSGKIRAITNEDDFILSRSEVDFLRNTLGDRIVIYPAGGHCGNMAYRDNVACMINFLK